MSNINMNKTNNCQNHFCIFIFILFYQMPLFQSTVVQRVYNFLDNNLTHIAYEGLAKVFCLQLKQSGQIQILVI